MPFMSLMQVDKEDNAILDWVFHQTSIPSIISDQRSGKLLHVDRFGDYTVEWHMAGDLKTLKCMYNIPVGEYKLGYIPKSINKKLAEDMDKGKHYTALFHKRMDGWEGHIGLSIKISELGRN